MVFRLNQGFYNMGGEPRYNIDFQYKNAVAFCINKYSNHIQNFISMKKEIKNLM